MGRGSVFRSRIFLGYFRVNSCKRSQVGRDDAGYSPGHLGSLTTGKNKTSEQTYRKNR